MAEVATSSKKTLKRSTSSGCLICPSCNKSFSGDAHFEGEEGPICNQCRSELAAEEVAWTEDEESSSEDEGEDVAPETSGSEYEEEEEESSENDEFVEDGSEDMDEE